MASGPGSKRSPGSWEGVKEVRQIDDKNLHGPPTWLGATPSGTPRSSKQEPDSRISWRSTGGTQNDGEVTFEPLDDGLTRVAVVITHEDEGLVDKAGDALGLAERRVRRDLERFKDVVESGGDDTGGGWRGEVRNGDADRPAVETSGAAAGATAAPADDDDRTLDETRRRASARGLLREQPLPSLSRLRRMEVRTTDGEKVGNVEVVYLDSEARYARTCG